MNRLRVLSLTMLTLLSASRLPGQAYGRPQQDIYIQPVVCNDGTISVFVAQAYLNVWNGRSPWLIQGWYEVKVGTCQKIGSNSNHEMHYSSSGMFGTGDDAVSFLAFAFTDSRGAFGAANVPVGGAYESSKQQFCVKEGDAFEYELNGEQSVLSRQCQAGYHLISASVAFYGYSFRPDDPGPRDYLHVNLGANDRAIPLGKPTSGGGVPRAPVARAPVRRNGDASPSLCGKVSCWDLLAQGVRQAAAQSAAANANHVPPPLPPADAPGPVAGSAPGSHADDPIGAGGFITPSPAHPQQLTARLIFGDAVRFDGSQWRFENGSAVPAQLIDQSGRPPLLPKQQYSTEQAPVAGYIQTIKNVLASFQGCKEYTDSAKTQFSYSVEIVRGRSGRLRRDGIEDPGVPALGRRKNQLRPGSGSRQSRSHTCHRRRSRMLAARDPMQEWVVVHPERGSAAGQQHRRSRPVVGDDRNQHARTGRENPECAHCGRAVLSGRRRRDSRDSVRPSRIAPRGQLLLPYDVFGFGLADGGRIPFIRRYIASWA